MSKELLISSSNALNSVQSQAKTDIMNIWHDIQYYQLQEVVSDIQAPFSNEKKALRNDDVCIYKVEKLAYDEDYPQREAFENVLMSLDNKAFNFLYILSGDDNGVSLYIGVVKNDTPDAPMLEKQLSASDYGEIVANNFEGNFNGSCLRRIKGKEMCRLLTEDVKKYKNAGVITGIPTVFEKDVPDEYDFQGIDRLINSMLGTDWRIVVVCEPLDKKDILCQQQKAYDFYNWLTAGAEISYQHSENSGANYSESHQVSDARGKNKSTSQSTSHSDNYSPGGEGWGYSNSNTRGTNSGISETHTVGDTTTKGTNVGKSNAMTMKIVDKLKQELMDYIDEELLERLKTGLSRGMFKTAVYYMADKPAYADRLKAGIKAIGKGNKALYSPLTAQHFDIEDNPDILQLYQNVAALSDKIDDNVMLLLSRPHSSSAIGLSTYLTPKEISVLTGLPQKEVAGIPLQEGVCFGLNEDSGKNADSVTVELGKIVQKNRILDINFYLDKKVLAKHTFIAGVTGSGKTTTCHKLLKEAQVPFLVIEPAKTEYRTLINQKENFGDIIVFTLGNEKIAPFRINPFELLPEENISAHIDMLKAVFTSAFPMEGSMPQIIEEALIMCYDRHGWDVINNENVILGDKAYTEPDSFPVMSELLAALQEVVKGKNFSERLKGDYQGTLISRFSNLSIGVKGSMLNCAKSLDFEYLAHHNVIIEMDEVKTPEDKALFMGFILTRMSAVIRAIHKKDNDFRHLTLVEEAHRLLAKVEPGGSSAKKSAVETFADLLAEVRKYGEGLIIVDQIPNKLAPEVLKNTNTKIIHKLLAKDDKEAVGDTMLLDDKQKEHLSALAVGEAIVFSENTDKPVQVKINPISNTNEAEIDDSIVRGNFENYYYGEEQVLGNCYDEYKLQPLYRLFDAVLADMFNLEEGACITIENEKVSRLKQSMEKITAEHGFSETMMWSYLLKYKDKLMGKVISNEEAILQQRHVRMMNYFEKLFTPEGIAMTKELLKEKKYIM